jgi:hypothetical protein
MFLSNALTFFVVLAIWITASVFLITNYETPWRFLMIMPGIFVAIAVAGEINDRRLRKFAKDRGLEPRYRPNQFRNGSFFAGFYDAATGERIDNPQDRPTLNQR